ncbi:MAG TPA: ABC transporter permease [Thermotogota bacterium]|nr:ABC transporter permease [Thermotogota bacterium]
MKWSLITANFRRLIKDFKLLLFVFTMPIIAIVLIASLTGPADTSVKVKMGIVNLDQSAGSERFIQQLKDDGDYDISVLDEVAAEKEYLARRLPVIITIPEDFFMNAENGTDVQIGIKHVDSVQANWLFERTNQIIRGILQADLIAGVSDVQLENHSEFIVFEVEKTERKPDGFMVLAFILTFMMFSIIFLGQDLIELRQKDLLFRMYATPSRPSQLTGSIMVTMGLFFIIQTVALFILGSFFMKGSLLTGNVLGSIVVLGCFILVNLSLGVLLTRLCRETNTIGVWANVIILPTGMVSGIFVPSQFLPDFLKPFSFLAPQHWVMTGIQKMNSGESLVSILPNIGVLLLFALCIFSAGILKFDRLVKKR